MATQNTIEQQLLDTLATRNFEVEKRDSGGNPTDDVDAAKTFKFDYVADSGKNYGTMVLVLDVDNDMKIMYGDNLGRTMEDQDKTEFFSFLEHLNRIATRNRYTHTTQDINQLKHTMQGIAAIKEGLFEGYYGNKIVSYSGEPTEARLMIRHSQKLGENDARYRHVESIFIETADGERFKLESRSLSAARAMLEHVRQGGKPYDIRGNHINEITREIAVLSRFNRASTRRVMEGATQEIVEQAQFYYKQLRENIKHLSTARGYKDYFETWHPATITEQDELVEDIKNLFIEQRIDSRIEEALPLLARLQKQGQDMKEIKMFESWVETLGEGTWALPDNPEAQQKLNDLMSKELIVGPDATNATEQLYDVVGDDELFDILNDLAERSGGRANVWDDTEVQRRLQELGVQMNTPSDAMQQPAPTPPAGQPQLTAVPQQPGVAEGAMPASVVKQKESIRLASNEENKKRFAGKTRDELAQMARRHGYGDKNPYAKFHDGITESTQDVAEGIEIVDQDSDLDQQVYTLNVDGNKVSFTYWDYENNFQSPDIKDIYQQAKEQLGRKLSPEQIKDIARAVFKSFEQGVAEGFLDKIFGGGTAKTKPGQLRPYEEYDGFMIYYDPEPQMFVTVGTGEFKDKFKAKGFDDNYNAAFYGEQMTGGQRKEPIRTFPRAAAGHMTYNENVAEEINSMRKAAGLPVVEGRLLDESGETLSHILDRFKYEVRQFEETGALDKDLYYALFDYYSNNGEMPYGVAKARDGDPREWVANQLDKELDVNEGFPGKLAGAALAGAMALGSMGSAKTGGTDPFAPDINTGVKGSSAVIANPNDRTKTDIKYQSPIPGSSAAINEGSCNMTAEGEYCPEHGLAECGYMESMGGTVAGSVAPVIGEDDPMEYNAAITSSFYESELGRLKKLALGR